RLSTAPTTTLVPTGIAPSRTTARSSSSGTRNGTGSTAWNPFSDRSAPVLPEKAVDNGEKYDRIRQLKRDDEAKQTTPRPARGESASPPRHEPARHF